MQLARGGEDRKRRSCNLLVDNCHATYVWPSRRMSLAWCPPIVNNWFEFFDFELLIAHSGPFSLRGSQKFFPVRTRH